MDTSSVSPKPASISRTDRRNQDRARFIETFEALTGFRPTSACPEALPNSFLDRAAPTPSELLSRVGNQLEPRTQNALRRQIAGLVDLGPWTFRRLLYVRGFGLFCLIDVMQALVNSDGRRDRIAISETAAPDGATPR
jgi:hypothetical protein